MTGFWIPGAECGETDGPLGAVYLARMLPELGIPVVLVSDPFCRFSLETGLQAWGCQPARHRVWDVPEHPDHLHLWWEGMSQLTHLLALERVGPSHSFTTLVNQGIVSLKEGYQLLTEGTEEGVVRETGNRCYTMRGIDITDAMRPAGPLFESRLPGVVTIGIGDGGNEIGMGKIPWAVIRNNIPNGARIACRVATDFLIVAGVSNWGAYALASGVALMKDVTPPAEWFDADREHAILQEMVEKGPLVDGVTGQRIGQVDGLTFDEYIKPLRKIERIVRH